MKLLTDLDCLAPPLTGIGHYTRELTQRLVNHANIEDVAAMYHGRFVGIETVEGLLQSANSGEPAQRQDLLGRLKPLVKQLPFARGAWQRIKAQRFRSYSLRRQPDVYWEPNFILKPTHCPAVVTIYDLSPLALPELHPASRIALLKRALASSVTRAERIVTISQFTSDALQNYLNVPAERIRLVPPAANASFRPHSEDEIIKLREQYALPEQYILSVGTLEPRKNLSRLLSAYENLPTSLRQEWPLVCVGARGWNDTVLSADIARLEERGELIRLGYVAQADLPCLTAAAGLIAYMSIYEGFGMPVVEGLACGVPVLTSQNTVMEEVAGKCAFYADPFDIDAISAQLACALTDQTRRARFCEEGPLRAATFDWQRSAITLFNTLREAY